jgi:hypothetical protein
MSRLWLVAGIVLKKSTIVIPKRKTIEPTQMRYKQRALGVFEDTVVDSFIKKKRKVIAKTIIKEI